MIERLDEFGGPDAYNHYAVGWAHAMDTPYQWTKQVASHWGGTRNGTIVHWPDGIKAQGRGPHPVPPRHRRRRRPSSRPPGCPSRRSSTASSRSRSRASAWRYSFDDARRGRAPRDPVLRDVRATAASTTRAGPRSPGTARRGSWAAELPAFDDDVWELYDTDDRLDARRTTSPPSSRRSSHELQRLFLIEAVKYNVLPLDDRVAERFNSDIAGRPTLIKGNTPAALRRHGPAQRELGRSTSRTSRTPSRPRSSVPDGGAERRDRSPRAAASAAGPLPQRGPAEVLLQPASGSSASTSTGDRAVPAGTHQVRMEFAYDGGGLGKGGTVDALRRRRAGRRGAGRRTRSPMIFSADETLRRRLRERRARSRDDYAPHDSRVHRRGQLGPDRHRRGRRGRRPPTQPGGAAAGRDGDAVMNGLVVMGVFVAAAMAGAETTSPHRRRGSDRAADRAEPFDAPRHRSVGVVS